MLNANTLPEGWRLEEETERGTWAVFPPKGIAVSRTSFGPAEAIRRALVEIAGGRRWWVV